MDLKKQICSLELAKKLKELGVPQVSLWRWIDYGDESRIAGQMEFGFATGSEVYSAFTVAEFGEMLPNNFVTEKQEEGWSWGLGVKGTVVDREANIRANVKELSEIEETAG